MQPGDTIVVRVPLRINLAGGLTDLKWFREKHGGLAVSCGIDKYVTVTLRKRDDDTLIYSDDYVESAFQTVTICPPGEAFAGTEITIQSDVSKGSGLGTSSAIAVGLLKVLSAYRCGYNMALWQWDDALVARGAHEIEQRHTQNRNGVGYLDARASAFETAYAFAMHPRGDIRATPLVLPDGFSDWFLLIDTGVRRKSQEGLEYVLDNPENERLLFALKDDADFLRAVIESSVSDLGPYFMGCLLDKSHRIKSEMLDRWETSQAEFERSRLQQLLRDAGACGSRWLGGSGGGHVLVAVPPEKREAVIAATPGMHVPFRFLTEKTVQEPSDGDKTSSPKRG